MSQLVAPWEKPDAGIQTERLTPRLWLIVAIAGGGLALGGISFLATPDYARWIWTLATLPALAYLSFEIFRNLGRGNVGLDIVAALAMTLALSIGEALAGAVIALMYSGGQLLENYAKRRALREMTILLERAPKMAARHTGATIQEIPVADVVPGDLLLVRSGEAVPVDGRVASDLALVDQSILTGESLPVHRRLGDEVPGGAINLGPPFDLEAKLPAAQSAYAAIAGLIKAAQEAKAPLVRLADRYGLWFLALTAIVTALTWLISGEAYRALAVLVVATPCPLILAIPVALISGISHCARHGVLVKDGAALETLARIKRVVIDKTGTLTEGRARLVEIVNQEGFSRGDVLRYAATLDLASRHVVAAALVGAALERGIELGRPVQVDETPGMGIEGVIDGRQVAVGGHSYVAARLQHGKIADREGGTDDQFAVAVAIDGRLAGYLILADAIRDDVARSIQRFRAAGVSQVILASGDRTDVAKAVGARLALDRSHGALSPQDKVELVRKERAQGCVMMVGDGVNDAPALAAADLGVALGARGATTASKVADVVLLIDRVGALADAIEIARRAKRMALQSANAGIGLSLLAMIFAALGYLSPVQGSILQELIDIGVVLNALRALGGGPSHTVPSMNRAHTKLLH
jgi:heavy metal translocating P-type ATPase